MKHQAILAIAALAMLMVGQTVSAAPLQQTSIPVSNLVYDNFDDNITNPALWYIEIKDIGPSVAETNHRLEITVPVDSTGDDFAGWYDSICQLRGDYDIQVDYQVLTWPNASGVRIGLADDHANMQRISSAGAPNDYLQGTDLYLTTFDTGSHSVGIVETTDQFGKLRLTRTGDTLSSYYFAGGGWVGDASYALPAYALDTNFYIGAWSADPVFSDQEVKVAFDNLVINAGELVCPAREVTIDIRGDGTTNRIIPRSKGVINVAVMTTSTFDASTIVPSTVTFARAWAAPVRSALTDVDLDGDLDLMLFFRMEATGILCGDKEATLNGLTLSGRSVTGTDTFITQVCR